MKRTFSILTSAFLILVLSFSISVIGFADSFYGDVNADGKISIIDAKWILQSVAGTRLFESEQKELADINNDGKISIVDAKWVLQTIAGLREVTSVQTSVGESTSIPDEEPIESTTTSYQKADTTELEALISQALEFDRALYTEETYSSLETAVADGQTLVDSERADESEVANAISNLENAINNLKTYRQYLQDTVDYAKSIDTVEYTSQSINRLNIVIQSAQRILNNENATTQQFIAAINRINNAIDLLETPEQVVEKSKVLLKESIDKANGIDTSEAIDGSYYSEERLAIFENALVNAQSVYDSTDSTKEEVEKAKSDLDSAISTLKTYKQILRDVINNAGRTYNDYKSLGDKISGAPDIMTEVNLAITVYNSSDSTDEDYIESINRLSAITKEFVDYCDQRSGEGIIDWT